jgi:predicted Zn-dependent protease
VEALGNQSGYGRDRRLHHFVRGLLFAARHDDRRAIDELNSAMYAPVGYTRTNYELARVYLRAGRPRDAVAVLQPVLHGPLDGTSLYVSRPELHELLARAWETAGARDSAAAHYAWVAHAWQRADASLAARATFARERLAALGGRGGP